MLSVNQLNAQIKLTEMWKAVKKENYPIKVYKKTIVENEMFGSLALSKFLIGSLIHVTDET